MRQQALQQRPDLRSRNAAVEVATGEVALAQAQRVPDVEVAFIFEREETGADIRQTFGGGLAVPLPLWNRNAGGIAAAQARTRVAALERTALQQVVTTEVANTVTELHRLRTSLQLFDETILPQSRDNLALLQQAFAAGEVGIVPLVTAQRAFIAISHEYLETRFASRTRAGGPGKHPWWSHAMSDRFPDAQPRALVYRSPRSFLLAGALAALLSGGCREAAEQPAGHTAGATTAAATRTTGPTAQERKGHTHDAATAPHTDGPADQESIRLSATARANLNLAVTEVATQTIEQVLTVPGVVKALPDRMAFVTPRLSGRIEKVYVNVGDVVTQGAPLLDLRSTEVEKLQVELLRTATSLSIVEQSYARTKELTTNTVLTELEQLQQEVIKAHGTLQLATAAVERTQQLSDKIVARKDLLAAQTEQQHARSTYDAARRKLRTYGVTEAQICTILNGGLDKSVLTNLGLSPQAAVQKYLVLGKPSELFALEADYRQKQGEVESVKRQLQILGFSAASIATVLQRGVPDPILTLTAPISGAMSARQATPGAMVEATEKLLELIDTSLVWIEGDVVEHLLTAVRPGQQARVRVAAYPEVVFTGIVRTDRTDSGR